MKRQRKKNMNPDVQKLARRIKAMRLRQGFSSYEHFAFDNFFGRTQYYRYENGEDMRFTTLLKLVRACGITLEEFF
jgi:hypothetical protein